MANPVRYRAGYNSIYTWRFARREDEEWMASCMDDATNKPGRTRITPRNVVVYTEKFIWTYKESNFIFENAIDFTNIEKKYSFIANDKLAWQATKPSDSVGIIYSSTDGTDLGWMSFKFINYNRALIEKHGTPPYLLGQWVMRQGVVATHPDHRGQMHHRFFLCIWRDFLRNASPSEWPFKVHSHVVYKDTWQEKFAPYTEKTVMLKNGLAGQRFAWDQSTSEDTHVVDYIINNIKRGTFMTGANQMFGDCHWIPLHTNEYQAPMVIDSDGIQHKNIHAAVVIIPVEEQDRRRYTLMNADSAGAHPAFANKDQLLSEAGYYPDFRAVYRDSDQLLYFTPITPEDNNKYSIKNYLRRLWRDSDWIESNCW